MEYKDGIYGWIKRMHYKDGVEGWSKRMEYKVEYKNEVN